MLRSLAAHVVTPRMYVAAMLGVVIAPFAQLHAQSVGARVRVDANVIPSYYSSPSPTSAGCQQSGSNPQTVNVTTTCTPAAGVTGTSSASLENGVLRSSARLTANNATFAAAGSDGADFMSVARVDYSDRVTFSVPANVTLTGYRFLIGWSGQLSEPLAAGNGVSTFSLGALYFIGNGGPFSPFGWVGITRTFSGLPLSNLVVQEFEGGFQGTATRGIDASGRLTTSIDGVSSFDGLLSSNTLDFTFAHTSEVEWRNLSANSVFGVSGELYSDFANSARITGLQLFDGDRDVTDLVGVRFASGFQLPANVPEPATVSLLAAAVVLLALRARRNRSALGR